MSVLTDMKVRGVEDILITATDNLKGFTATIKNVFPEAITQICVVHQIRKACRYVVWKDKKGFTSTSSVYYIADMKPIYNAPTKEAAKAALVLTELVEVKTLPINGSISTLMLLKAGERTGRNLPCFLSFL